MPQDSVLDPLFIIMYLDDFPVYSKANAIILYVDDTPIIHIANNPFNTANAIYNLVDKINL